MKTLTLGSLLLAATVASVLLVTGVPQLQTQADTQAPRASSTLHVQVATTSGVTRGGLSVVLAVSTPDARKQLLTGTTDLRGTASFDLSALSSESQVTAFVRDGDRCALSATQSLSANTMAVELPDADSAPLRVHCVDPDGRELQPATIEVLEAQHLAPHGVQHARLWSTRNSEDGTCPIVFPTGSLRVTATLPQGAHTELRSHALAEVAPGATEAVLVFGRKSPTSVRGTDSSRGTVALHCLGAEPTAQVHIVSHGLALRDARMQLHAGKVELGGLSAGTSDLCVRTSDGRAALTTVEVQGGETTEATCELHAAATLELQTPATARELDWQVLACNADGVAMLALEQGTLAPGETHKTLTGLPATPVLIVCSSDTRWVVRATLEAGATTSVPLHTPSAGTELQVTWPAHMTVRTLTFALVSPQQAHAGTHHTAVMSWHTPVSASVHEHISGAVPAGVYDIVAYPDAGSGTPVARLRAEVTGPMQRVDLALGKP